MEKRKSLLDLPMSASTAMGTHIPHIRMGGRTSMGMGAMGSLPMRSLDLPMAVPKTKGGSGLRMGELRMSSPSYSVSGGRGLGSMSMKMPPSHSLDLDMRIPSARRAPMQQAPQMQMAQPAQLQAYPAPQPVPLQQPPIQKAYGMGRVSTAPYQGTTVQVYTGGGRPRTIVSQQKGLIVDRFGRVIGRQPMKIKRPVGRPRKYYSRTRVSQPLITEKAAQEVGKAAKEVLIPAGQAVGKGISKAYKETKPVVVSAGKKIFGAIKESYKEHKLKQLLSKEEKEAMKRELEAARKEEAQSWAKEKVEKAKRKESGAEKPLAKSIEIAEEAKKEEEKKKESEEVEVK